MRSKQVALNIPDGKAVSFMQKQYYLKAFLLMPTL